MSDLKAIFDTNAVTVEDILLFSYSLWWMSH
jgi:hypothetical protein